MAKNSEKPKFSMKLLIDEEKNKVVLAEAGKDFVDLLSDLLTLPMGTIVRLLEKHQSPPFSIVGCFNNLYKSVSIMDDGFFETQACKNLLLYPKSIKKASRRRLKLYADAAAEETKFFICPNAFNLKSCRFYYSNFSTSICSCGKTMDDEITFEGEEAFVSDFLSSGKSFIITDDMKIELNSMSLVLNVLNTLGYAGFSKLQERVIDVSFEKVLALLVCIITSETPLTDTFLRKQCIPKKFELLNPPVHDIEVGRYERSLTLKVFVRKLNGQVLHAECSEDFVDFLFSFVAIPFEFAWELSLDNGNMGCGWNLCRSIKELRFENHKKATFSRCVLPHYYNFREQLLDVDTQDIPEYECLVCSHHVSDSKLSMKIKKKLKVGQIITTMTPVSGSDGFVKGETNFVVTDDLVVTPIDLSSTISLLSKLQMNFNDVEVHSISIGKREAANILRASLITNSALTNGLSNLLSKIKQTKATQSTKKIIKSEE